MWRIVKEKLSDGSIAFNVSNGECHMAAYDQDSAIRVLEAIEANTCERVCRDCLF